MDILQIEDLQTHTTYHPTISIATRCLHIHRVILISPSTLLGTMTRFEDLPMAAFSRHRHGITRMIRDLMIMALCNQPSKMLRLLHPRHILDHEEAVHVHHNTMTEDMIKFHRLHR
jgi:hypothetical protein